MANSEKKIPSKKTAMGTCPKCGGSYLDYYDVDYYDEGIIRKVYCYDCKLYFDEYEKTIYDGYSYEDESGNLQEFDADGEKLS